MPQKLSDQSEPSEKLQEQYRIYGGWKGNTRVAPQKQGIHKSNLTVYEGTGIVNGALSGRENDAEEVTGNTDAVDREIEKLKKQKQQLEQQIRKASGDEEKRKELEKKLAQAESELSQKDNDTYREEAYSVYGPWLGFSVQSFFISIINLSMNKSHFPG